MGDINVYIFCVTKNILLTKIYTQFIFPIRFNMSYEISMFTLFYNIIILIIHLKIIILILN